MSNEFHPVPTAEHRQQPRVQGDGLSVTLQDVQQDWRMLDASDFEVPEGVRLISHEEFPPCPGIEVEYVPPGRLAKAVRFSSLLFSFVYALQLLYRCDSSTVVILDGRQRCGLFAGLLNALLFRRKRHTLNWGLFVEVDRPWKRIVMRLITQGMELSVVWSKAQVPSHAKFLHMPKDRFLFIPYKANHSKGPRYELPTGNFIFAGGNGKRDYCCLIEAVRDTGIPVIISATDVQVRNRIEPLPNVIVLAAPEPAFAQLQAASRFVVVPMQHTGLKGGGEANFCNGMWHGKPVIAADSIAADDYIIDGQTGYVVPSGDNQMLRQRILELWNDVEKTAAIGEAARRHVEENFTHNAFIRRLLTVALLLGCDGDSFRKTTPIHRPASTVLEGDQRA